jgi:hypothetical protein
MSTIGSGVIGSAAIHVVRAAHMIHSMSAIVTHRPVIHARAAAGHRRIVPTATHVIAFTLTHWLSGHWLGVHRSTSTVNGVGRTRLRLCENRSSQRQCADGG